MTLFPPIEPMLAEARGELPADRALPGHLIAEQKPDGFRAVLFARTGKVMLQSRNGANLTPAFPEIAAAASALEEDLVLDGELVVPHEGRLHFGQLQNRARRRARGAVAVATEHPAYLIVFDALEAAGVELLDRPYRGSAGPCWMTPLRPRGPRGRSPWARPPGSGVDARLCSSSSKGTRSGSDSDVSLTGVPRRRGRGTTWTEPWGERRNLCGWRACWPGRP